jgi:hypothetical protein
MANEKLEKIIEEIEKLGFELVAINGNHAKFVKVKGNENINRIHYNYNGMNIEIVGGNYQDIININRLLQSF